MPEAMAGVWSVLSDPSVSSATAIFAALVATLAFFYGPYKTHRTRLQRDTNRLNAIFLHIYQILLRYDRAVLWARGDGVTVEVYEACHDRIQPQLATGIAGPVSTIDRTVFSSSVKSNRSITFCCARGLPNCA